MFDHREIKKIIDLFPHALRDLFQQLSHEQMNRVEEIRVRVNGPILIHLNNGELVLHGKNQLPYIVNFEEIQMLVSMICNYSIYSFEAEIRNGFITLDGGHRVGLCGECINQNGILEGIKNISFINIRIAHEIKDAAKKILPYIIDENKNIYNTLIISPPRCGKTTLLRDIARQLSTGIKQYNFSGVTTCIVDERSEIAASIRGQPSNDVGIRTDVIDKVSKAKGVEIAIRCMSPRVIILDEIGRNEDAKAIEDAVNAGVSIITSIHANSVEDFFTRASLAEIQNNIFDRYIVLNRTKGPGTIKGIYDHYAMEVTTCISSF